MSQLQYRNENQNFLSNFVFQFIKKMKWRFRFTDLFLMSRKQVRKSVGLLWKSQNVLSKSSRLLIRPHHDHGHIIYGQA